MFYDLAFYNLPLMDSVCNVRNVCNACAACSRNQFRCVGTGTCIPLTAKCNRRRDCADGSDETNCSEFVQLFNEQRSH